jgi:hypothetical protein
MKTLNKFILLGFLYIPLITNAQLNGPKYNITQIGSTIYDLQTNASVARRIIVYPDGKMSAVWNISPDASPFMSRGTGFNHFNGKSWLYPPVKNRIEKQRTGWPNVGMVTKNSKQIEYIISHNSSAVATNPQGGIVLNINDSIGSTNWHQDTFGIGTNLIWFRTAESGDYIYIIGAYSDTTKYINNVKMPVVFSRYRVSTGQLLQKYVILPGFDTSLYKSGSGDNYAIDAHDNIVAIVVGMCYHHVTLWKSVDYGATFTRNVIDSVVVPTPKHLGDTVKWNYNDGSVSVIIDNNGYCKVVWAYFTGFRFDPSNNSVWYYRYKHGLIYYNEKDKSKKVIPTAKVWDRNGNNTIDIENAWDYRRKNSGYYYNYSSYGYTNYLLSFPQITIDSINNLYIIYSAVIEDAYYFNEWSDFGDSIKENYRDVYVVYSKDDGDTWGPQQNLTNNPLNEDVFASVAKNCYDNKLHIIFQEDEDPGTSMQNLDPQTENLIFYLEVPCSDILNNLIGPGDSSKRKVIVPTTQASNIIFNNVTSSGFSVSCNKGSGSKLAFFIKQGSSGNAIPFDSITYTPNTVFGSGSQINSTGWYCVYNDVGNSVIVSNLQPNTTYRLMVCGYNGTPGKELYNKTTATTNPANQKTSIFDKPSVQASNLVFNNVTTSTFWVSITKGNGFKRAIFIKIGNVGNAVPVNNITYTPNTSFGSGSQIGTTGWYCVYNDTGRTVSISNLTSNTIYRVMVCEYNGMSGTELYNTSISINNPLNQTTDFSKPTVQASGIYFSNITTTNVDIKYTRGNGSACLVFITSGVSSFPPLQDNTSYVVSSQVADWSCIFNGTASSTNLTGSHPATFRVMVCEYNGTTGSEKYFTDSAIHNPYAFNGVSIGDEITAKINFYPNPTTGQIVFENAKGCHLTIYNTLGVTIYNSLVNDNTRIFDLDKVADGIYLLKLEKSGYIINQKIILKR